MAGGLDARFAIRLRVDAVLMRNPPPRSNFHDTAVVSDSATLAALLPLADGAIASDLFRANAFSRYGDVATASDSFSFTLFSNDALKFNDGAIASDSAVLVLTGNPEEPSTTAPAYAMTTDDGTVITDGQGNVITTQ